MARSLRMYGKKRGHRRTGSRAWGSLGEALFFGFFLVLGSMFLAGLLNMLVVPEWRVNHEFIETAGTVLRTSLGQPDEQVDKEFRNSSESPLLFRPEVLVEYAVGDSIYKKWTYDIHFNSGRGYSTDREIQEAVLADFQQGQKIPVWYDPADPETVVVVRGYTWLLWFLLLLPAAFILIGGVGLILTLFHWGKSVEHRVATTQMARRLNPLKEPAEKDATELPFVPQDSNLTNSPGTRLKYRLPIDLSRGWRLLAILSACVFWNSIVAVFALFAINEDLSRRPEWLLTALVFGAAGVAMIYFFVRELLLVTAVGPTQLEISDHPLVPGRRYEVYVSQGGRLTINELALSLVCDEVATYRQGTDTRTEQVRVFGQKVFERQRVELLPQRAFEEQIVIEVPLKCMHSFKADHNEVRWRLLVRADIAGWPPFERSFPVVVIPRPGGNEF